MVQHQDKTEKQGGKVQIVEERSVPEQEIGRMTLERAKELLNNVINHISVANNCHETIRQLIDLGFTGQELCEEFSFNLMDISPRTLPTDSSGNLTVSKSLSAEYSQCVMYSWG